MKKRKATRKRKFQIVGTIGIVSVFLAIILIISGNFIIKNKENVSKADDVTKVSDGTNFGNEYGLYDIPASDVNNRMEAHNNGIELLTVASSFYNYRYDNEIKKGWRNQGIDGELSGVGNPFSIFNSKLSERYKKLNDSNATESFGIYVGNFYNYWKGSYRNYDWCLENYEGFKWAQNIANRGDYSAVCQGLVGTELTDFNWNNSKTTDSSYNLGTLKTNNNDSNMPFFDKTFLNTQYDSKENSYIGVVAENVGFPFRYAHDSQKGSYYVFDSKYDVVRFAGSESEGYQGEANTYQYYYGTTNENSGNAHLNYYYKENQVCSRQNKTSQFLPFNQPTSANNLDFGFGMRVDIPFYLTDDGCQVDADGGKPMKFNFEGDDDVWVFIDGKLVLDLGGAHAKTKGSIDFSEGGKGVNKIKVRAEKVSYTTYTDSTKTGTAGTNNFEASNSSIHTNEKIITGIQKDQVHVLTVFYMERGMIESNLYMDFNFIPHNEEIDAPPQDSGSDTDDTKTASELTVKTEINFDKVSGDSNDANSFRAKVENLAEDDAFRYKIENEGTGSGNVQDSGIQYPSGVLSVRENQGKRTYWSYGEAPKIRVYFDLQSANEKVIDANTGLSDGPSNDYDNYYRYRTAIWDKPYIVVNNSSPQPMATMEPSIANSNNSTLYYYDINRNDIFYFTSDKKMEGFGTPVKSITNKDDGSYYINGVKYDYTFLVEDGMLYQAVGFKNNRQNYFLCTSQTATPDHPAGGAVEHSLNLPYQTTGPVCTFAPTNAIKYNTVSNTSYRLTEYYTAAPESYNEATMKDSTDIHIFENNSSTSGKTDSNGIFSLLSEDSATFLNQFRMDSNMRIVQQDNLGVVNRTTPPPKTANPDLYKDATGGNAYVSTITAGTRKSKDFYYTAVSTINTPPDSDEREVTVSKTGEFKFANVKRDGEADFTSSQKITINETFTNQVKTGNLCISKEVTGMKDTSGTYSFSITFKDVFGVSDGSYTGYALAYKKYDANKAETTGTLDASDPIVELKAGEKIIIEGIPVGTKYKIQETNTSDAVVGNISISYQTKVNNATQLSAEPTKIVTKADAASLTKDEVYVSTGKTGTIEGMIPTNVTNSSTSETVNEFDEVDVNVTFTNQKGVLRIEKLAIGEWQNFKNEEYTFTITGDDTSINSYKYDVYEYKKITGESVIAKDANGTKLEGISITDGTIKLKATQWALIQDIPLTEAGKNYTITETPGNYYKIDSIDKNAGDITISADKTNVSMPLSYKKPNADVTFVNRYDPAYITINKYVDALYYQMNNTDGTVTEKPYSDVTDDEISYQELTDSKQSFIFTIDEYNTEEAAKSGTKQGDAYVKTFQVVLSMDPKDGKIKLDPNKKYTGIDNKEHTYRYKNSKTIKLTLGRFYRISEDTTWSWKYDLQGIGLNFNNTTGKVHAQTDKYIVFEGGSKTNGNDIPVINFYNTLTEDEAKLSTDGDTDVVVNIIKPTD